MPPTAEIRPFVDSRAERQFESRARTYWMAATFATIFSLIFLFPLLTFQDAYPKVVIGLGLMKNAGLFLWGWQLMREVPVGVEPGEIA